MILLHIRDFVAVWTNAFSSYLVWFGFCQAKTGFMCQVNVNRDAATDLNCNRQGFTWTQHNAKKFLFEKINEYFFLLWVNQQHQNIANVDRSLKKLKQKTKIKYGVGF